MIKTLIIIILLIVIISLLGVSLGDVARNEKIKENFAFVIDHIQPWAKYGFDLVKTYIWTPVREATEKVRG